jgi:stearoyl-CoA desaturase (delta-9 desaturase)
MRVKELSPHFLKIILPLHLLCIAGVCFVFLKHKFDWHYLLLTFTGWILICGYGIAIGYHRFFAHRSFKTYKWVERALAFLGCLGAQGSPIFWMSLHMSVHHPYSDKPEDIHSPTKGMWSSYLGWQMFLQKHTTPLKAGLYLASDPFYKFIHKNYYKVVWSTVLLVAAINPLWCLFGLIIPMVISMHQENLVNSLCHTPSLGYRNFATNDNSMNNILLGLFCFGQGWHNNHHAIPNKSNFGERWFEVDPSRPMIALIKKRSRA